jgi:hypothetical protein
MMRVAGMQRATTRSRASPMEPTRSARERDIADPGLR